MKLYFKSNSNFLVTNPSDWIHQLFVDMGNSNVGPLSVSLDNATGLVKNKNFDLTCSFHHLDNETVDACLVILETQLHLSPAHINQISKHLSQFNIVPQ